MEHNGAYKKEHTHKQRKTRDETKFEGVGAVVEALASVWSEHWR